MSTTTEIKQERDESAVAASAGATAFGRIIVVRHGRPNKDREAGPRLNWREYREWWAGYEEAPLLENGQKPSDRLMKEAANAPFVFSSSRPRAIGTAKAIAQGRDVKVDPVFIEATLPPPHWPEHRRYLPKTWNKIARIAWLLGHADEGDEHLDQARERASRATDVLVEAASNGHDVVLAAHGWFNRMLRPELKMRGFACRHDGGDGYWSFRIYEKR